MALFTCQVKTTGDYDSYLSIFQNATSGKGADNIIEMLANVNLEADLEMAAACGKIVVGYIHR